VLLGYARVSTADQSPNHQVDALHRAGVDESDIYVDHASGAKASRPQLDHVLRMLRMCDTLTITRLDRLGRSVLHLVTLGADLRERGVGLHVIEQGIDTSTSEGGAMFEMLSVLSELQREQSSRPDDHRRPRRSLAPLTANSRLTHLREQSQPRMLSAMREGGPP